MTPRVTTYIQLPTYKAGLLHTRAYRKLTDFLSDKLKENDLSLPEWASLGLVCETDGIRLQDIAEALAVEPPFATRIVSLLEKKGYVVKNSDSLDSRAKHVTITEEGTKMLIKVEKQLRKDLKQYLSGISLPDLTTYISVLDKISRLP